ncbi:MAG TPA: hypothetical protein VK177_00340 [Flavobacteriales bacterium]|nr:hypothetical protein [Flavobacteriales bacterium]
MGFQLKYMILPVFLFLSLNGISQSPCEKVYEMAQVEAPAEIPIKNSEFINFVSKEIVPILEKSDLLVPKLFILFTISDQGEIISVEFPRLEAKAEVHKALAAAFLKLGKWKPAVLAGKNVCSEFAYAISCLKWQ